MAIGTLDVLCEAIVMRAACKNDTFFIIKQHPNLDLTFISIKKHEMEITLNFVFSRNVPFLFSKEGTLIFFKEGTLNFFNFWER